MPWHISERRGRFCVIKDGSGEEVKCHASKAEAAAHMRALYANEPAAGWAEMGFVVKAFEDAHPFGRAKITIESPLLSMVVLDCEVASTNETRARGMIGRGFPDGVDGLLFAYDEPVAHAFHMVGVPVQLHIAWFAADGTLVDHVGMFTSDPWRYAPPAAYRWALELPVRSGESFDWLTGARLVT